MKENKELKEKQEDQGFYPEIEGYRHTWFYVCGACHGVISWHDQICKHCGRRINWNV